MRREVSDCAPTENAADEMRFFALFPSSKEEIMRTSFRPSSAVALALAVATLFAAGLAGAAAQQAMAQPPAAPPLTGEFLAAASGLAGQAGTIDIRGNCRPASGRPIITYTATGPATGPYPGTFREAGTATLSQITPIGAPAPLVAFTARFTIDSPVGRVSGTRQLNAAVANYGICWVETALGFPVELNQFVLVSSYEAVISTAAGTCTTAGTGDDVVAEQDAHPPNPSVDFGYLQARFLTGTPTTCVAGPTSKQQCKKGGWRLFRDPSFKNQGQCIKYVNHQGAKAGKKEGDDEKGKAKKGEGHGGKKK
jgi:hypothetical protein